MTTEINAKLLRYVPKKFHAAIRSIWKDDDGYWIMLNEGWLNNDMDSSTFHELTLKDLLRTVRNDLVKL